MFWLVSSLGGGGTATRAKLLRREVSLGCPAWRSCARHPRNATPKRQRSCYLSVTAALDDRAYHKGYGLSVREWEKRVGSASFGGGGGVRGSVPVRGRMMWRLERQTTFGTR